MAVRRSTFYPHRGSSKSSFKILKERTKGTDCLD